MANHNQTTNRFNFSLPRGARAGAVLILTAMLGVAGSAGNSNTNRAVAGAQHGHPTTLTGPQYFDAQEALANYIAGGNPFTYKTGMLACQGVKSDFDVTDPIVVEVNGHELDGYITMDGSARGFSVGLVDPQAPGAPTADGLPACQFVANPADPYPTDSVHLAVLASPGQTGSQKGGGLQFVDAASGQPVNDVNGQAASIALWSVPQK